MSDSIFTKIIKGDVPCHKVYEDNYSFAFMDIYPIRPGMVVVVTKRQAEDFLDLTEDEFSNLMVAVQKIAKKMKAVFPNKKRIGVQIEGLDVPHVHIKLFPIDSGAEFHAPQDTTKEPDHESLAVMAKRLAL
jgi:histidine triad (HIT) family protein